MLIEEGSPFKEKLLKLLEAEYAQKREGTHVSDLVLCIREQVFRNIEPMPIDEKDLVAYALGEGAHVALEKLAEKGGGIAEREIKLNGVIGTIDVFDNVPIEIKTTRAEDDTPRPYHIKQLTYYMAMTNSNVGILLYLMVNDYEKPFRFRTITLSDAELSEARKEIETRSKFFNAALAAKDPFIAPHVKKNSDLMWKCQYCKYREKCWSRED